MSLAFVLLLAAAPLPARAAKILVVASEPISVSSEEAIEGLRSGCTEAITVVSAGRPLPPGPHGVIVAFGGRAARRAREGAAPTVVALAPAFRDEGPSLVRVAMTPSPERFIELLQAAGARRLLAVRGTPADSDFVRRAAIAGKAAGIVIDDRLLSSPDRLPGLLRRVGTLADAVWLAPDPAAVTPETYGVIREFSRARSIPFFAPTEGLVADGIRSDLTVSFRECGREAARAAVNLLAGRSVPKVVYADPRLVSEAR
ncbi:MAG: hypothetical protein M0D55_00640 [Elusimicrobiota bacterium]|nr:MAG: hypothetical protein M0D55_00640 [Elusimicrobiota bacterium]